MTRRSSIAAGATTVLLGSLLAGCGGGHDTQQGTTPEAACHLRPDAPTALAIGARANVPQRTPPDQVTALLDGNTAHDQRITIVRLDGAPRLVFGGAPAKGANTQDQKAKRSEFVASVKHVLDGTGVPATEIRSQAPEADVLGALTLAARATPMGGNVIVMDSGLQTTAPLDFRQGLLQTAPQTIVDYLSDEDAKQLPDLTGRQVMFSGLGDTAAPQARLDNRLRKQVIAIWTGIAHAAGARCVIVDDTPGTGDALSGRPPVSPVALPAPPPPPPPPCGTTSYGESDDVGFVKDSDRFRTPGAAKATLRKLADVMRKNGDETLTLTGATSSEGSDAHNQTLSEKRAAAVKRVLVSLGVGAGRITTRGVGEHLPGRVPDVDSHGKLLLGPAIKNRQVIAKLSGKNCAKP